LVAASESSWLSLSPELNENKKRLHNNYIQWNTHLHWSEHAGSDILHAHYPARKILNAHSRVAGFIKSREWKKSKIWKFDSNNKQGPLIFMERNPCEWFLRFPKLSPCTSRVHGGRNPARKTIRYILRNVIVVMIQGGIKNQFPLRKISNGSDRTLFLHSLSTPSDKKCWKYFNC
jgi:hypothetical protein